MPNQRPFSLFWILVIAGVAISSWPARAQEGGYRITPEGGRCLVRADAGWTAAASGQVLPVGKTIVAWPETRIVNAKGDVQLHLLTDLGQRGPLPALDTGIVLHAANDVDLDFSFERGIVFFNNMRNGDARIRIRVGEHQWLAHLQESGTTLGMEIYGRLPPGLSNRTKDDDVPCYECMGICAKGQVFLERGTVGHRLMPPPGTCRFHWESCTDQLSVQKVESLSDNVNLYLNGGFRDELREMAQRCDKVSLTDLEGSLKKMIASPDKQDRIFGVTFAGALDVLPATFSTLAESPHADARDQAILVTRSWLGRSSGQADRWKSALKSARNLTDVQVQNALHLVVGFDHDERAQAVTYDILITQLQNKNQAIRELARWHLVRLVPEGKNIAFDAAGTEESRRTAVAAWRQLIPEGQLPPSLRNK